jgi:4-hydroxy-tetrahydrodipicolinate reductase
MKRIGVLGAKGRMGRHVRALLEGEFSKKASLSACADQGDSPEPLLECDVVIDFSLPSGMLDLARKALQASRPLPAFVVASTGWTIDERKVLEELATKTAVLMSSNFSTGVLALMEILKTASPLLEKLGYSPVLVETHHKHKKDHPSGTALSLQRVIAPAGPGNIPTHSIRAGEIVGDHEVTYYGPGDHIVFGHFAQDRSIFARGAIQAALWLSEKRASGGLIGIDAFFKELL